MPAPVEPVLQAVLLAGGTGSRLGGEDKALLMRGGSTLLSRWLEELELRKIRTAVVGPVHLRAQVPEGVDLVQEEPAFSGPAAGILAGARALQHSGQLGEGPSATLVLAVDLVSPGPVLEWLLAQLGAATAADAVLPRDESGRDQYLCMAVPTAWLQRRAQELGPAGLANARARTLLDGFDGVGTLVRPVIPAELGADIDTVEDALRWGIDLPGAAGR